MIIDSPTPSQIPALRQLWSEAFGDGEEFLDVFFSTAFSPHRCRCITEDGEVLAALYWFNCVCEGRNIAYLYAIATASSHRGRGLCTALMKDTHDHLKALGYTGAILVPGEKSLFEFYEKKGYGVFGGMGELHCSPSADTVNLRRVDSREFAALRRNLLPRGGVIQEAENLEFLQASAEFYAGDGFLMAACLDNGSLFAYELLGNVSKAPAILNTLGCAEGRFRISDADTPFAMYLPLSDESLSPPTYFGFAFD